MNEAFERRFHARPPHPRDGLRAAFAGQFKTHDGLGGRQVRPLSVPGAGVEELETLFRPGVFSGAVAGRRLGLMMLPAGWYRGGQLPRFRLYVVLSVGQPLEVETRQYDPGMIIRFVGGQDVLILCDRQVGIGR